MFFRFHDHITANSTGSEAVRQAKLLCDIEWNLQLFLDLWWVSVRGVGWCTTIHSLFTFKCPTFRKSFQYQTKFACVCVSLHTCTILHLHSWLYTSCPLHKPPSTRILCYLSIVGAPLPASNFTLGLCWKHIKQHRSNLLTQCHRHRGRDATCPVGCA